METNFWEKSGILFFKTIFKNNSCLFLLKTEKSSLDFIRYKCKFSLSKFYIAAINTITFYLLHLSRDNSHDRSVSSIKSGIMK